MEGGTNPVLTLPTDCYQTRFVPYSNSKVDSLKYDFVVKFFNTFKRVTLNYFNVIIFYLCCIIILQIHSVPDVFWSTGEAKTYFSYELLIN